MPRRRSAGGEPWKKLRRCRLASRPLPRVDAGNDGTSASSAVPQIDRLLWVACRHDAKRRSRHGWTSKHAGALGSPSDGMPPIFTSKSQRNSETLHEMLRSLRTDKAFLLFSSFPCCEVGLKSSARRDFRLVPSLPPTSPDGVDLPAPRRHPIIAHLAIAVPKTSNGAST